MLQIKIDHVEKKVYVSVIAPLSPKYARIGREKNYDEQLVWSGTIGEWAFAVANAGRLEGPTKPTEAA